MAEYLIQDTTLDAIADAINAKTGSSSAMTPAQMVTAIGSISGGGGYTFDWATSEVVTIGANNVSNTQDALAFFNSYSFDFIFIISELTVNNQIVCIPPQEQGQTGIMYRWRNNVIGSASITTGYDAYLVEGTKYLVLKKRVQ